MGAGGGGVSDLRGGGGGESVGDLRGEVGGGGAVDLRKCCQQLSDWRGGVISEKEVGVERACVISEKWVLV